MRITLWQEQALTSSSSGGGFNYGILGGRRIMPCYCALPGPPFSSPPSPYAKISGRLALCSNFMISFPGLGKEGRGLRKGTSALCIHARNGGGRRSARRAHRERHFETCYELRASNCETGLMNKPRTATKGKTGVFKHGQNVTQSGVRIRFRPSSSPAERRRGRETCD